MPGYGASPSGGSQAYQPTPGYANGNGAAYPANGNGYAPASANGNGYASQNGAPQANGYPRDGYAPGQPAGRQAADYPPAPGYAPVGQAEQAQQGYWDAEQQQRGNWT